VTVPVVPLAETE
jgi:hypothetical protein